jgi:hypothetical protein
VTFFNIYKPNAHITGIIQHKLGIMSILKTQPSTQLQTERTVPAVMTIRSCEFILTSSAVEELWRPCWQCHTIILLDLCLKLTNILTLNLMEASEILQTLKSGEQQCALVLQAQILFQV